MSFSRNRIRLAFECTNPLTAAVDASTGASPLMPKGRAVQFELAFFNKGALDNLAEFVSVLLEVKSITNGVVDVAGAPVMTKAAGPLNTGLTLADWNAGTSQHCVVTFEYTETGLTVSGTTNYQDYAVIVTAVTSAGPVTVGTAIMRVVADGGRTVVTTPALGDPAYVRLDDFQAALANLLKRVNEPGVDFILVNNLGYGVRVYPTPDSTQPQLETDLIAPPS